jgi:glutaredoxin
MSSSANITSTIPGDLRDFLTGKNQLKYNAESCEAGRVTLKRLKDLSIESIYIDTEDSSLAELDPNVRRVGYYAVPAVSLIAKCEHCWATIA